MVDEGFVAGDEDRTVFGDSLKRHPERVYPGLAPGGGAFFPGEATTPHGPAIVCQDLGAIEAAVIRHGATFRSEQAEGAFGDRG